jgi:hypothetical protein
MRYNDRNFSKFQERQRNGDELENWLRVSERKIRRERDHRHATFYMQCLTKFFEKEWWLALETRDKEQVYTSYYNQEEMRKEEDDAHMWSNFEWFDTWDEWRQHILDTVQPNRAKLRELRVKKLGL